MQDRRQFRHKRLRQRVTGTAERPRLSVFRSARAIHVQFINDAEHRTLLAVQVKPKDKMTKTDQATAVGAAAARLAKTKGITAIVFDRAGYKYHGRVRALADSLRKGGLNF